MRKLLYLIIGLLTAVGCKDYLNVQPQGEVIPTTDEEFAAIIHNHLRDIEGGADEYIIGNMETILRLEGCADDLDANIRSGSNIPSYAGELINSRGADYRSTWTIIRDCNIVIENLKGRSSDTSRGVLAAAYSIKAICYFNLMRDFCDPWDAASSTTQLGLPIVDAFDISATPSRSSLSDTYTYTLSLFDAALEQENKDPLYYFTEYRIKAYKARLLFWCEQWSECEALCEDIIAGCGKELCPPEAFSALLNDSSRTDSEILARSHINSSSELEWYFTALRNYVASRPFSSAVMDLFTPYGERDCRFKASIGARRLNAKQPECKLRLGEIVLTLSECCAHLGRDEEALKWLNTLRAKRISGDYTLTADALPEVRPGNRIKEDAEGKPLTALMQAIFDERRRELLIEGDRWYELKRNGRPEWWVISNGLKYTTRKYLYTAPIYKGDIDLNSSMIQNEGYE